MASYTKREVEEAIMILELYGQNRCTFGDAEKAVIGKVTFAPDDHLAWRAWIETNLPPGDDFGSVACTDALEAAQRLREGWRP